jgi:hypothetical protein
MPAEDARSFHGHPSTPLGGAARDGIVQLPESDDDLSDASQDATQAVEDGSVEVADVQGGRLSEAAGKAVDEEAKEPREAAVDETTVETSNASADEAKITDTVAKVNPTDEEFHKAAADEEPSSPRKIASGDLKRPGDDSIEISDDVSDGAPQKRPRTENAFERMLRDLLNGPGKFFGRDAGDDAERSGAGGDGAGNDAERSGAAAEESRPEPDARRVLDHLLELLRDLLEEPTPQALESLRASLRSVGSLRAEAPGVVEHAERLDELLRRWSEALQAESTALCAFNMARRSMTESREHKERAERETLRELPSATRDLEKAIGSYLEKRDDRPPAN